MAPNLGNSQDFVTCMAPNFGDIHGPKPCKLIRFSDIHGPKPRAHGLCLSTGSLMTEQTDTAVRSGRLHSLPLKKLWLETATKLALSAPGEHSSRQTVAVN